MKKFVLYSLITALVFNCTLPAPARGETSPVSIVYDTDIEYDVDDTIGLAVLHALQARREIDLAAVTIVGNTKFGPPFVDAVNHFYGQQVIPIGFAQNPYDRSGTVRKWMKSESFLWLDFLASTADRRNADGSYVYPHAITVDSKIPAAVDVLRRALAERPDGSVILNGQGPLTNIAALLQSGPDQLSPLDGRELIKRKVRYLVQVGGYFGAEQPPSEGEFNLQMNMNAAQAVIDGWPTKIIWNGAELGPDNPTPGKHFLMDYGLDNPIAEAYNRFHLFSLIQDVKKGVDVKWPYARASWASAAALYAARPDRDYFTLSEPGDLTLLPEGHVRFMKNPNGRHRFLSWNEAQKLRALEAILLLASQPPTKAHDNSR